MLTTVHGRVELDPAGIPRPASMSTGRDDAFEQVLQQATDAEPAPRVDSRHPEPARSDADPDDAEPEAEPKPARDEAAEASLAACEAAPAQQNAQPAPGDATADAADATETIRRGEPVRQETAGKGADSPRTSAAKAEPLLIAAVQHVANAQAPLAVSANGDRAIGAVGGARAADATARGGDTPLQKASTALRAPATTASYRTTDKASVELLEQARDSVFKQILVKLTGDGGEMRLRLEPPDLGELDLRLVVENGNRLQLTIASDRQDTAQMLHQHLDELVHTLQQAGLDVAGASVQTRSEFEREQQNRREQPAFDGASAAADETSPTTGPQRTGWVRASGLDFWA